MLLVSNKKNIRPLSLQICSKFLFLVVVGLMQLACLPIHVGACNITQAKKCKGPITEVDIKFMKTHDYTKEQLYKYCDKGKAYVDCLNSKLKCCDQSYEFTAALVPLHDDLQMHVWRLGPFCAGMNEMNVIRYKCKTTVNRRTTTSFTTRFIKKTTWAPCRIEKVSDLP